MTVFVDNVSTFHNDFFSSPEQSIDNLQSYVHCQWKTIITPNPRICRQRITFSAYFDSFNGLHQRKLLFQSNLPCSDCKGHLYSERAEQGGAAVIAGCHGSMCFTQPNAATGSTRFFQFNEDANVLKKKNLN
jgi:hypothetical protein